MPGKYKGRRYQGPNKSRYTRYLNKTNQALTTANNALRTVKMVKDLLNVEYKRHDKIYNDTTVGSGIIVSLSATGQGDDVTDRNGRSIKAVRQGSRYSLVRNTLGDTNQFVRMIWFQDMHMDGAKAAVTDVLNTAHYLSYLNPDNFDRFKIIKQRMHVTSTYQPVPLQSINIELNSKIEYIGTDATDASGGAGNIFCLIISSEATYGPDLTMYSRLRYIDN